MTDINERIAVEVMGWKLCKHPMKMDGYLVDKVVECEDEHLCIVRRDDYQFLTDWNAMRLVIEKMRESGYQIHIIDEGSAWYVHVHGITVEAEGDATHESLPTAVCLAALEAVKGD